MTKTFEYGWARVKDLGVQVSAPDGQDVEAVLVDGEPVKPHRRFWLSLQVRFGFTSNIFKYFRHQEVFDRISAVATNDRIRWCIERDEAGHGTLLAVTSPQAPVVPHDDLMGLLGRYPVEGISYCDGVVRSVHAPRCRSTFDIAGDGFQNKFVIDTPIDGYGRPSIYLSLLRQVCSNGAIGYGRAFRSELALGRGQDRAEFALVRALDCFNNEDGYGALRQRFESAAKSWASVHEANKLYRALVRVHHRGGLLRGMAAAGHEGAHEPLLQAFHRMTGDLPGAYGLANLDALSVKRQRTLPVACRVYDLLNFASETATHHATVGGNRGLQAFIGDLISSEYDLEGTAEHFSDWKDFFVAHEATTETLASLQRR